MSAFRAARRMGVFSITLRQWQFEFASLMILSTFVSGSDTYLTQVLSMSEELEAQLTRFMRPEIEPCDDFFEYVCGRLPREGGTINFTDREEEEFLRYYTLLRANISQMLTNDTALPNGRRQEWLEKARAFHNSCLAGRDHRISRNFSSLAVVLEEIFALHHWDSILGALRRRLTTSVVFSVSRSMVGKGLIEITQSEQLFIVHDFYIKRQRMTLFWHDSVDRSRKQIERLVGDCEELLRQLRLWPVSTDDIIDFEERLADSMVTSSHKWSRYGADVNWRSLSFAELRRRHDTAGWNWARFMRRWPDMPVSRLRYHVRYPMHMHASISLLQGTPTRLLRQYAALRAAAVVEGNFYNRESLPSLAMGDRSLPTLISERVARHHWLLQSQRRLPVDVLCVETTARMFPSLQLLAEEHAGFVSDEARITVSEVTFLVKEAMRRRLHAMTWLGDAERAIARDKLNRIQILITYPLSMLDERHLNELYRPLEFTTNQSYLEHALTYADFFGHVVLRPAYREFIFGQWPFYIRLFNTIGIQAAFLQRPHFDAGWPSFMRFAAIGHAVGHELAHAFDSNGWFFLANGSYYPIERWSGSFLRGETRVERCFERHYSNYHLNCGVSVDGRLTLAENMADVVGLQLALDAFRLYRRAKDDSEEVGWDWVEKDPERLFFIALARTSAYCLRNTIDANAELVMMDTHTPDKYRLLGMLRNSADFARTFECASTSYMNPDEKCTLFS